MRKRMMIERTVFEDRKGKGGNLVRSFATLTFEAIDLRDLTQVPPPTIPPIPPLPTTLRIKSDNFVGVRATSAILG
ncbi:hypothetical protein M0804_000202 [Polistes exclamans]|nr:hypothetical protein M0804_000202 [Polistes exclamans]